MTLAERFAEYKSAEAAGDIGGAFVLRELLLAHTATRDCGTVSDRLLRLAIWVGGRLRSAPIHTGIVKPIQILASGVAWCDQHVKVFIWAARALGLIERSRELALAHNDGESGHTVAEVYYEGAWHLHDVHPEHVTAYYSDTDGTVLSYEQLRANPPVAAAKNHWWRGKNGVGKEGFYTDGARVTVFADDQEA